jgi:hypothetical protein
MAEAHVREIFKCLKVSGGHKLNVSQLQVMVVNMNLGCTARMRVAMRKVISFQGFHEPIF